MISSAYPRLVRVKLEAILRRNQPLDAKLFVDANAVGRRLFAISARSLAVACSASAQTSRLDSLQKTYISDASLQMTSVLSAHCCSVDRKEESSKPRHLSQGTVRVRGCGAMADVTIVEQKRKDFAEIVLDKGKMSRL